MATLRERAETANSPIDRRLLKHIVREFDDVGVELADCELVEVDTLVVQIAIGEGLHTDRAASMAGGIFQCDHRALKQPFDGVKLMAKKMRALKTPASRAWLENVGAEGGYWKRHPELCETDLDTIGMQVCRWAREFAQLPDVKRIKRHMEVGELSPLRLQHLGVDPTNGVIDNFFIDWAFVCLHPDGPDKISGRYMREPNQAPIVFGAVPTKELRSFVTFVGRLTDQGCSLDSAFRHAVDVYGVAE